MICSNIQIIALFMLLRVTAVEVYFDDCYDLLNKKAKIPIAG